MLFVLEIQNESGNTLSYAIYRYAQMSSEKRPKQRY